MGIGHFLGGYDALAVSFGGGRLIHGKRPTMNKTFVVATAIAAFLFCTAFVNVTPAQTQELDPFNLQQMIGQTAPPWSLQGWVNSKPLELKDLRGKVILLRFINDNPGNAPTLNELYRTRRDKGLVIVGLYTPEPMPQETSVEHVQTIATTLGFDFPLGIDSRWETVNRYWLMRADAASTGTTFVIDRKGVIRYIQADGAYDKFSRISALRKEYTKLENAIEKLLKAEEELPAEKTGKR